MNVFGNIFHGEGFHFYFMIGDEPKRSFAKAISWRLLASIYLFFVVLFLSKQVFLSLNLAVIDAVINIIEYYLHERVWNRISWGK